MSELQFTAFEESGKKNTEETLNLAKKNADALGIKKIVIASTTGFTIEKAIDVFDPEKYELICVTHNYGFKEGIEQEFPDDKLMEMRKKGVCFVTGTLAFSGVQSHLPKKFNCWDMSGMFARLLRSTIGDGVKVVMEMSLMACDAGMVKVGEDLIAIAGTGSGADTCALIKASSTRLFTDLKIKAILAKPYVGRW